MVEVDMSSHNGLRGICSIWVMIFHTIFYSKRPIDFQGSSLMPLFFMLSGFSLAIAYGDISKLQSSYLEFYQNRFARVIPVYYVCLGFSIPLLLYGYGDLPQTAATGIFFSILFSFIPLCTTFIFLLGSCVDGPGWTVCSLIIIWLIFPTTLPFIQRQTNQQLLLFIAQLYWIQLFILIIVFVVLLIPLGFWVAFAAATMNPFSRYPLFLMGVCGGELSRRISIHESYDWPVSLFSIFPNFCFNSENPNSFIKKKDDSEVSHWKSRSDYLSIYLLCFTLLVTIADALSRYLGGGSSILGSVWLQAIVPFIQLNIIISLTRDNNESQASKFLNTNILQWFGKISMCIYLVHFPVMKYACWILHGSKVNWPDELDCTTYDSNNDDYKQRECESETNEWNSIRSIPLWCAPIVWCVSIILATMLYYGIEEPARKCLRVKSKKTQNNVTNTVAHYKAIDSPKNVSVVPSEQTA